MWSNYQLIDPGNGDENFIHMVLVAPLPMLTYTTDLTWRGYEVVSQFVSALQQGKSLTTAAAAGVTVTTAPINTESTGLDVVPEDNPTSASKATT